MKNLLRIIIIGLFSMNMVNAQISDTMLCVQGIDSLQYKIDYDNQSCVDSCDSYYSITPLIGSGNYIYQITGNSGFSSANAVEAAMCPDDYICVVTDMSSGIACTILFSIDTAIAPPPLPPLVHSIDLTHCSATGVCDGEAELTISGGNPPYIITWYDAAAIPIPFEDSVVIDSLCAGSYFYSISNTSNGGGCGLGEPGDTVVGSGLVPFTINEELIVNVLWTMDEMCEWMCDGFAELQATGGTGNYIYDIGFQSGNSGVFGGLCPTIYSVTVTDDQGNSGSTSFEIFPAFPTFGSASSTNETCLNACDGTITFDNSFGELTDFSIDGGFTYSTDLVYANLCPDVYSLSAINFYGCPVYIGDITITSGDGPTINSIETSIASSAGNNDGCITQIDVSGGIPAYTYSVDGSIASFPVCGLPAGDYDICVADQNGCTTCEIVQINECALDVQSSVNEPFCAGECNGLASLFINGANGPVAITWQDMNGNVIGNMETLDGLCAGQYVYTVIDSLGCETSGSIGLLEPNPITINTTVITDVATNSDCLGEIDAIADGGNGSFGYQWYICNEIVSFGSGSTISNLCPGEYYVIATDNQGCQIISECDTIQNTTGIEENEIMSFEVYPIPTENMFVVETQITGEYTILIVDLAGKVVTERNVSASSVQFSSENEQLTPGIYFIEIDQENVKLRKRIVIQ